MKRILLVAMAALVPSAARAQGPSRDDADAAARTISAEDFARRIGVLANDSMRGRDTPSPELTEAANWVGSEFRRMGLEPGGDRGTFIQGYPVRMGALSFPTSAVRASSGRSLTFGADVLPLLFGPPARAGSEGVVVVLSGTPDLDGIARLDLARRAVVAFFPDRVAGAQRARLVQALLARQPASLILSSTATDDEWNAKSARLAAARFPAPGRSNVPVLEAREGALVRLLARAEGQPEPTLRPTAGPLQRTEVEGVKLSVTQELREVEEIAPNVVGILKGSDPNLQNEYVVFSAHLDHVGVGPPNASGDSIYNGADDNASGSSAVMEVAEAMAALRVHPRRSMMFVLVSGEEKGLWGSEYLMEHPPVPTERLVADLNIDMVGRNWTDTVVVIGREHSDMGATLARVNQAHAELGMAAIDDLWPEERFFFRSDHYNFARKGVPALFFFNGVHPDYHEPSDSPEKINSEKAARIARLVFYLGLEIGGAQERPRWNPDSYRKIVQGGSGLR